VNSLRGMILRAPQSWRLEWDGFRWEHFDGGGRCVDLVFRSPSGVFLEEAFTMARANTVLWFILFLYESWPPVGWSWFVCLSRRAP